MKLDEFINNNYKHLLQVAKRIAKKEAEDLINSTYLIIFDKKNFKLPSNNEEAINYFITCLNNNYKFYNSSFNRQKRGDLTFESSYFEQLNQDEENDLNHVSIKEFKETLPEHERILFELRYEDEMSLLSISEEFKSIGLDRNVLRKIDKPLKEKIKSKWKK